MVPCMEALKPPKLQYTDHDPVPGQVDYFSSVVVVVVAVTELIVTELRSIEHLLCTSQRAKIICNVYLALKITKYELEWGRFFQDYKWGNKEWKEIR